MVPTVTSRTGAELPVLGQGTWRMGEDPHCRAAEVAALQQGLDLGLTLIDTAEMYAEGGAERVVGEAIRGRRSGVYLVSKVLPYHASRDGTLRAAEQSLERLGTDRIDLYLLHWPGRYPLEDTFAAFERLVEQGKIVHYGVSNFDRDEMRTTASLPAGAKVATNQVLYNLQRRGVELRLLPWCAERGIVVMAYSPLDQGRLQSSRALERVATRHRATPEQVAIAWCLTQPGVVTIPKAADPGHVRANAAARRIELDPGDLRLLDEAYPRPDTDVPLETA